MEEGTIQPEVYSPRWLQISSDVRWRRERSVGQSEMLKSVRSPFINVFGTQEAGDGLLMNGLERLMRIVVQTAFSQPLLNPSNIVCKPQPRSAKIQTQ